MHKYIYRYTDPARNEVILSVEKPNSEWLPGRGEK